MVASRLMDPFWLYPRRRLLFGTRRLLLWRLLCMCCILFLFQSVASVNAQSNVPVSFTLQDAAPSCSPSFNPVRSNFSFGSWRPDADATDAGWVSINSDNGEITHDNMTSVTSGEQATPQAELGLTIGSSCPRCLIKIYKPGNSAYLTHENSPSHTIKFLFSVTTSDPTDPGVPSSINHEFNLDPGDHTIWIGGKISEIDSSKEPGKYTGTIRVDVVCN